MSPETKFKMASYEEKPVTPLLVIVQYLLTFSAGFIFEVEILGKLPATVFNVMLPALFVLPAKLSVTGV